jgi:hypothetical protein
VTLVSYETDSDNCGGCGNACSGGKICSSSNCVCPAGTSDCFGCVLTSSFQTDHDNCGGCGNVCGPTQTCSGGTCHNPA